MRRRFLCPLIALAALLAPAAPAAAIVGGRDAPAGQFRYVANIAIGGMYGCTGTLIAPQWVITAGHCGSLTGSNTEGTAPTPIAYPPSEYSVTLGTVNADGSGGETHSVVQVVIDSGYFVTNGSGNDVTLLELDRATTIKPMLIANPGDRASWEPGKLMTIAGFGLTSEGASQAPSTMQYAHVPVTTDAYCQNAYPNGFGDSSSFDASTEVCAGYPQGGTDTCSGDSGGPLLAPQLDGTLRLVGATSFGQGCAQAGHPGVYARLAEGPIRSFIQSVVPAALAPAAAVKPAPKPHGKAKPKRRKRPAKRRHR